MSTVRASATRSSSSCSSSSSGRYASAASVTRWSDSSRRVAASAASRAVPLAEQQAGLLDRQRGAVRGELEQVALLVGEHARGEAADVQHADDAALHEQRDAEQRLDALLAQDRVEDVGVVDVGDGDRAALGGDAPGEAAADRDADALLDLLLDALGGARVQRVALQQQDRHRVDLQDLGDPAHQLLQEVLLGEEGERGVGDPLQRVEDLPVAARAQQRWRDGPLRHRGDVRRVGHVKVTKIAA